MIAPHELFALLSDETRLRCLFLLQKEKELCVCEFGEVIGSIQPKISRHLALLRKSSIVLDERRGQWVYYRINQSLPEWIQQILASVLGELNNTEPYRSDFKKIVELRKQFPCSS